MSGTWNLELENSEFENSDCKNAEIENSEFQYFWCFIIESNNFVFDDLALSCTESMIRVKVGLNRSHDY